MSILNKIKVKIEAMPFFNSPFFLQHRQFVVPGLVLAVAILISGLVTIPQFVRLFDTFKTIQELTEKRNFFEEKITALENIDEDLYRKNLETALVALPVDKDIPGVTGELLTVLNGSGMSLQGINFAANNAEGSEVSEYTLKMDIVGGEDNFKTFLERVKTIPRIVKMTALEISSGRSSALSISVSLVAIYQKLPENIGAVDEELPQLTNADSVTLTEIKNKIDALPQVSPVIGDTTSGKPNPFVR